MKKTLTLALCLIVACSCYAGELNEDLNRARTALREIREIADPNHAREADPGFVFTGTTADGATTCFNLAIGYQLKNRFETGVLGRWFETNEKSAWTPTVVGPYLIYLFDEFLTVDDEAWPNTPLEEFLHSFKAIPYGGLAILRCFDGEDEGKIRLNLKTGFLFVPNLDAKNIAFVVDYTIGDWALNPTDKWALTLGGRFAFPKKR